MAVTRVNTFSGGTNSTAVSTANSGGSSGDAFTDTAGATYRNNNATGLRSPMACELANGSGFAEWSGFSMTGRDLYVRIYLFITAAPSIEDTFFYLLAGGLGVGNIGMDTTRHLKAYGASGGAVLTQTGTVATSTWTRVEAQFSIGTTTGNGAVDLRRYDSADSATSSETTTAGSLDLGTTLADQAGFVFMAGLSPQIDDVGITDSGFLGPVVTPSAPRLIIASQAVNRSFSW